jgi:hypothetical protein
MITKLLAPALLAAAAAAVISAPAASAGSTAECDEAGMTSVCSRNGHAAIIAEPRQTGSNLMITPGGGFFGGGQLPLLAID